MHPCYVNRELLKGGQSGLLKLLTDKALVEDPKFHPYVKLYAKVILQLQPFILPIQNHVMVDVVIRSN